MSCSSDEGGSSSSSCSNTTGHEKKYKGVRRRKWGKWVSEIRVPGTQDRLWLGSYSTPEAAAVAHDIASYCLRGPLSSSSSSLDNNHLLNFPALTLPAAVQTGLISSPRSIQKAASDAGMAVDAAQYNFAMKQQQQPTLDTNVINDNINVLGIHDDSQKWQTSANDDDIAHSGICYVGRSDHQLTQQGDHEKDLAALNISVEDYL